MPLTWTRKSVGSAHGKLVHSRRVRVLAAHFAALIPHGHSVLDVGCGDGLLDSLILARRPDVKLTGVEVLVRAGVKIPAIAFDGRHLPFVDRSWDTVMFCDVLHHTEAPGAMLAEAVRVAKHCVVIKDHTADGFLARPTLRFMDLVGNAPHGVVLTYNYFRRQRWEETFAELGLGVDELRTRLGLYPKWAEPVFGRSLHFIARCRVSAAALDGR